MKSSIGILAAACAAFGILAAPGCIIVEEDHALPHDEAALIPAAHPSSPMHGMQDGQLGPGAQRGPGPQAGMLEQMRAHHRCIEGEMAKRPDGGRAMPDKAAMSAMMQRCPMPAAMHGSMMMMQQGQPAEPSDPAGEHADHPAPTAPAHTTPPDEQ